MSQGHLGRIAHVPGPKRTIAFAIRLDGSCPAREFLEGLSDSDESKVANLFRWMADHGEIKNGQKFKRLDGPIWEFKSHQIRIPCFQDGTIWVLTHGFRKKSDQAPKSEVARAHDIHSEYLSR